MKKDSAKLVELREYSLPPGAAKPFLSIYEARGWPIQSHILGTCLGWYSTDVGDVNGLVHLWAYADAQDRDTRRQRLSENPSWNSFLAEVRPYLVSMRSRLLRPASFTPPHLLNLSTTES